MNTIMLTQKQVEEIKFYINKSENPLIFYDDDPDGLCSYLLLNKFYQKGKGIIVKGKPVLDIEYLRKVKEYSPDLVVVLDKPMISQEFIDSVNVPIVWIDHHPVVQRKGVHYYNPKINHPDSYAPTTTLVYQITNQDLWIAAIGSLADWHIPKFIKEFQKLYPDLISEIKSPEQVIFETKFGELIRIFSFLLKGKTSDVSKSINIIKKINNPREIIYQESPKGKFLYKRAEKISKLYNELLEKAVKYSKDEEKILLFIYPSSKISFTSELSNELLYKYPDRIIIIGREKDDEIKLSLRSSKTELPPIIEKSLENVKGYGGGHKFACGANISKGDFKTFIENFKSLLNSTKPKP